MLIKVNYCDYGSFGRINDGITTYMSDCIPRVNENLYFDDIGCREVSSIKYHIEDGKLSYVEVNTQVKGID